MSTSGSKKKSSSNGESDDYYDISFDDRYRMAFLETTTVHRRLHLLQALRNNKELTRFQIVQTLAGYAIDEALLKKNKDLTGVERLRSSMRTKETVDKLINRDLDFLESFGIKIDKHEGTNKKGAKVQHFSLAPDRFNITLGPQEMVALKLAAGLWQKNLSDFQRRSIEKGLLGSKEIKDEVALPIDADISGGDMAVNLAYACVIDRCITVTYSGESRMVDPWYVSFYDSQWYLRGWDLRYNEPRNYRVERISNLTFEEKQRSHQPDGEPFTFSWGQSKAYAVFNPDDPRFGYYGVDQVSHHSSRIASQAPQVLIVEPTDIYDEVVKRLTRFDALVKEGIPRCDDRTLTVNKPRRVGRGKTDEILAKIMQLISIVKDEEDGIHIDDLAERLQLKASTVHDYIVGILYDLTEDGTVDPLKGTDIVIDEDGIVTLTRDSNLSLTDRFNQKDLVSLALGLLVLRPSFPSYLQDAFDRAYFALCTQTSVNIDNVYRPIASYDGPLNFFGKESYDPDRIQQAIERGIIDDHPLAMEYMSESKVVTKRVVDPLSIEIYGSRPRFHAWCHKRDAQRTFFFSNILRIDVIESQHRTHSHLVEDTKREPRYGVVCDFEAKRAWVSQVATDYYERQVGDDGHVHAILRFFEAEHVTQFLLAYGCFVSKIAGEDGSLLTDELLDQCIEDAHQRARKALGYYCDEKQMNVWRQRVQDERTR